MDDTHVSVNETNEQYHADVGSVSSSMLKTLHQSARIYQAKYITRSLVSEPSPSMRLGTAVHCAALEPERYAVQYTTPPEGCTDRRTTKFKDWKSTVQDGTEVLTNDEADKVARCCDSLRSHPIIGQVLEADGEIETSRRWIDELHQVPCKMRLDKMVEPAEVILDIKTVAECDEEYFAKSCAEYLYMVQAAHYIAGSAATTETKQWQFIFAAVETKEPFRSRAWRPDEKMLEIGEDLRHRLLTEFKTRASLNDWADPGEADLLTIGLPTWYLRQRRKELRG